MHKSIYNLQNKARISYDILDELVLGLEFYWNDWTFVDILNLYYFWVLQNLNSPILLKNIFFFNILRNRVWDSLLGNKNCMMYHDLEYC